MPVKPVMLGIKLSIKVSTANIEASSVLIDASTIQVHPAAKSETKILISR